MNKKNKVGSRQYVWKHNWKGWYFDCNIKWESLKSRKKKEYFRRIIRCLWLPGCKNISSLYDDWRYEVCKQCWECLHPNKKFIYGKH